MRMLRTLSIVVFVAATTLFITILTMSENKDLEAIFLTTSDNVKIAADLYEVENPKGWFILAHMMPATKESWKEFALEAQKFGYESLAIDLRGHGESDGGPNGYQKFTAEEHRASIKDLEAALFFLELRGAKPEKTTAMGASIGANLALNFAVIHPEMSGAVLLSSGNYQEIDSGSLVKKLLPSQKLLLVASKKDERTAGNNAEQNKAYYDSASQLKNRHLIIFDGAGHGTDLFNLKEEYDLTAAILKFVEYGKIN